MKELLIMSIMKTITLEKYLMTLKLNQKQLKPKVSRKLKVKLNSKI